MSNKKGSLQWTIVQNFYTPGHLHGTITQCCFIMHSVDTVLYDAYCVMLSSPDPPKFEAQRAQPFQPPYTVNVKIAFVICESSRVIEKLDF